jgi:hypothetical protein
VHPGGAFSALEVPSTIALVVCLEPGHPGNAQIVLTLALHAAGLYAGLLLVNEKKVSPVSSHSWPIGAHS